MKNLFAALDEVKDDTIQSQLRKKALKIPRIVINYHLGRTQGIMIMSPVVIQAISVFLRFMP
jgi:hypothetical protein